MAQPNVIVVMQIVPKMKKEIYICDKCGKEVNKLRHFSDIEWRGDCSTLSFDLCKDCKNKLKDWLKEK